MTRLHLAAKAAKMAIRLRAELGVEPADSVSPFDLAQHLCVVVQFVSLPTLEGVYSAGRDPVILISSQRPPGRRNHTCAHELGHHVFGHGQCFEQLAQQGAESDWQPEEFVADRFAVALLMPKLVVDSAISRRGWSVPFLTAEQAFVIAQDLGVGYGNLIGHLELTLGALSGSHARQLRLAGRPLRHLRKKIAGFEPNHDLIVADRHWGARPIDVEVGDVIVVPDDATPSGGCVALANRPEPHLLAVSPGEGSITLDEDRQPTTIRVSRRNFTGLARYRHLEDPDDAS